MVWRWRLSYRVIHWKFLMLQCISCQHSVIDWLMQECWSLTASGAYIHTYVCIQWCIHTYLCMYVCTYVYAPCTTWCHGWHTGWVGKGIGAARSGPVTHDKMLHNQYCEWRRLLYAEVRAHLHSPGIETFAQTLIVRSKRANFIGIVLGYDTVGEISPHHVALRCYSICRCKRPLKACVSGGMPVAAY